MTSALQICKAALEFYALRNNHGDRFSAVYQDEGDRARAALEAAAKVGDDVFVCNAVCCDDSHPDHVQELRRLLNEETLMNKLETDMEAFSVVYAYLGSDRDTRNVLRAIDAYQRGAR